MDEDAVLTKSEFCFGCLAVGDDKLLENYAISNDSLKILLKENNITLCFLCTKIAQKIDNFVQNIQTSQKLLENLALINKSTLTATVDQLKPILSLVRHDLDTLYLDANSEDCGFKVFPSCTTEAVEIKREMKVEDYVGDILDGHFVDDDEFQDHAFEDIDEKLHNVKEENLVDNGEEFEFEPKPKKRKTSKKKEKYKIKKENKLKLINETEQLGIVERIYLSDKEQKQERVRRAAAKSFVDAVLKCEDCLKPFQFRSTYDDHMEKHSMSAGKFKCTSCQQRFPSLHKLRCHQKYHKLRFKCTKCDMVNANMHEVEKHYHEVHEGLGMALPCSKCSKIFNCKKNLQRHEKRHALKREGNRAACALCGKTYANERVLKVHMANIHGQEIPGYKVEKAHPCDVCGKSFRAPSYLKKHMISHKDTKDYYCVECDKGFKSEIALQAHLQRTKLHVNEHDFRFPCQHCDKKFTVKRDLERHTNSIHLQVKPFSCLKCDRAYVSKWSLTEHIRLAHEGYVRPRKFPCTMCDKTFDRIQILKSHILTHTGERPFACGACGAAFTQRSVLRTHARLVHLRLRRGDARHAAHTDLMIHTS